MRKFWTYQDEFGPLPVREEEEGVMEAAAEAAVAAAADRRLPSVPTTLDDVPAVRERIPDLHPMLEALEDDIWPRNEDYSEERGMESISRCLYHK